jgi:hypothetical protein
MQNTGTSLLGVSVGQISHWRFWRNMSPRAWLITFTHYASGHFCTLDLTYLLSVTHEEAGMSKQTSYGKIYRPDIRVRPHLPRGRDFTHRRVFTVRDDGKKCVRAGTNLSARTRAASLLPAPLLPRADVICCPRGRALSASAWTLKILKIK